MEKGKIIKMDMSTILKMAIVIAKELGVLKMQLNEVQKNELRIVLDDLKPQWLLMNSEQAYEDIYKTLKSMIELWRTGQI